MYALASKKVLVTGGAGFLGRVVVDKLRRERGVTDVFVPRRRDFDLTRHDDVVRLYREARPQAVIHLAAEVGGIGANKAHPGRFFYANAAMGMHLIEEGRLHGVERFVQTGTICTYPKFAPVPFREEDNWNGYPEETNAPYGVAKKALQVMLAAYRDEYGFDGVYVLPVNLFGPGDNFHPESSHVIPALIRRMVEAREAGADEIVIWGTGEATREFLYVDDCAEGILLAAERLEDSEPVNLGTGREIRVAELAALVAGLVGFPGRLRFDPSKPEGQPRRCLDTRRAEKRMGFKASMSLEEGLRRTIEWFEQQRKGGAVREVVYGE
jgi:GDP-L-fucose synthase